MHYHTSLIYEMIHIQVLTLTELQFLNHQLRTQSVIVSKQILANLMDRKEPIQPDTQP